MLSAYPKSVADSTQTFTMINKSPVYEGVAKKEMSFLEKEFGFSLQSTEKEKIRSKLS